MFQDNTKEPIAVVGMACRFPGANSPEAFWDLLKNGVDAIREVPAERWNVDAYYDPQASPGKMNTRWGGFLDRVGDFDARFFGISAREAIRMDPQQRILLETSWEALENAGLRVDTLSGSKTGVFVGIGSTDYLQLQLDNHCSFDAYVGTGNAHSIAANRISYLFNFKGPSVALDTACSSSLVAIHLAIQSLRNHESNLALAGGVNLILKPDTTIVFSQARMMSSKGRCFTFDAEADGYVRSEGCGVVVLKRYSEALRDGDPVLALILGSAVNQDGKSNGLTAPNGKAQEEVIEECLRDAQVRAKDLSYFEAHGTGTPLGDPIEIQSIANVLKKDRVENEKCWIASVKTNVGHLEVASGVAGLMKVILSLQNKQIPPHLHFKKINPYIPLHEMPLRIPVALQDWKYEGKRIAGINSFGFGGANASLVVQEVENKEVISNTQRLPQILKISGKSEKVLRKIAKQYSDRIKSDAHLSVTNFAYSANVSRTDFEHRAFLLFSSKEELEKNLEAFSQNKDSGVLFAKLPYYSQPKTAFLFTGQGAQYPGMARKIYEQEALVRSIFDRANEVLKPYWEKSPLYQKGKSFLDMMFDESSSLIHETALTQPALFMVEYALAELWKSWGVQADYVMGHSVGEYVAACYAGVMTWEEALGLVAERGRLMQSLPKNGLMAVIHAAEEEVRPVLTPYAREVSIAGVNGPKNVVISGEKSKVEALVKYFADQNVNTQMLTVSHAFHSPLMDPILNEFEKLAAKIDYKEAQIALISNLTGRLFEKGEKPSASYWKKHLREAVRFYQGIETLLQDSCELFLELGPQAHLSSMGRACVKNENPTWVWSLKKEKEDRTSLLEALGKLYLKGCSPRWTAFNYGDKVQKVPLPTYPFERERFWAIDEKLTNRKNNFEKELHPLLGAKIDSPYKELQFLEFLQLENLSYLKDHRIKNEIVFPGAAYIEMVLAATNYLYPTSPLRLQNFQMKEALFLSENTSYELGTLLSKETQNEGRVQILSREISGQENSWKEHVSGEVRKLLKSPHEQKSEKPSILIQDGKMESLDKTSFYQQLHSLGLQYGPAFQALSQIYVNSESALGFLHLSEEVTGSAQKYLIHPSLLDAGFQLVAAFVAQQGIKERVYLPSAIKQLDFIEKCPHDVWVRVKALGPVSINLQKLKFDLEFIHPDGRLLLYVHGFEITALHSVTAKDKVLTTQDAFQHFYEMEWQVQPFPDLKERFLEGNWLCFVPKNSAWQAFCDSLKKQGAQTVLIHEGEKFSKNSVYELNPHSLQDFETLYENLNLKDNVCRGIVFAWDQESLPGLFHWMKVLLDKGTAIPLYLLTDSSQSVETYPVKAFQAPLWGFARSLILEHPEIFVKRIDYSDLSLETEALLQEISMKEGEDQLALRKGKRFVERLKSAAASFSDSQKEKLILPQTDHYRLEIEETGTLEAVSLKVFQTPSPQSKELQIRVYASALNFSDVLKVLGLYPGLAEGPIPIGIEFSGKVEAVGSEVSRFKVGDEVFGVAPFCFGTLVSSKEELLAHKPSSLTHEEAATLPIAYLTAHYALNHLGRMRRGERILIHAGAGGVGVAAIHLAKMAGLEIFATAGSPSKREFLKQLGVQHVLDSRSLDFADQILEITQGKGVDLVLNSLAGDFIPKSISVLAAYGRFLEIGKIDIYQNSKMGLLPFQDNLSYFAIDLDRVLREKPEWIKVFLDEIVEYLREEKIKALPHTDFRLEDTVQAFRYMAQRKNIGKVVIQIPHSLQKDSNLQTHLWRKDASYLITGAMGGLGLELAKWMHQTGARSLVLLGRSSPNVQALSVIEEIRAKGCRVEVYSADVSIKEDLKKVLDDLKVKNISLAGIFHAAGLLKDGIILKQDYSNFQKVCAPKIQGAQNLHELTQAEVLDYFVLFSSLASILGSPGQSNYAAANAYMDALANERKSQGLPALSIHWGPWAETGMAARAAQSEGTQSAQGVASISLKDGFESFGKILQEFDKSEIVVANLQWKELSKLLPSQLKNHFLAHFMGKPSDSELVVEKNVDNQRDYILSLREEERKAALVKMIRERVAKVLGNDPSTLSTEQALNTMGLDSLMAIEMKNDLEAQLKTTLPMLFLLKGPSIEQLADYLKGQIQTVSQAPATAVSGVTHALQ